MTAFVVLWNPSNWEWPADEVAEATAATARGETHQGSWSTGTRHRGIKAGDRAYLLRQGHSHRGLVAAGQFASEIYWDEHWNDSGRDAPYANIAFERVLAPADALPVNALVAAAEAVPWTSLRGGGMQLPVEAEAQIEQLWADHLARLDRSPGRQRNPPWAWDEIVLALDLYFRIGVQSSTHPDVVELSEVLNHLPIHSVRPQADRFRNPNSVNLKLANLAHCDPDYAGAGMARGSRRDREVFETYVTNRVELVTIAAEIRSMAVEGRAPSAPEPDEEEADAIEGRLLYRRHRMRERDLRIVKRKKAAVLKSTGRLACEACDLDFGERYGQRGEGFIECHHTQPLAESGETVTRVGDLTLLCSNCYRMVHLRRPMLSVDDLRVILTQSERA